MKRKKRTRRLAVKVSSADHVRGSPLAEVTLVGYADFTCPDCAQTYQIVKKIQAKMGVRLRYVFRSFPQAPPGEHCGEAAEAAECASSQGKFWEMHDRLFENQGASNEFQLSRYATDLGLDLGQFLRELKGHVHSTKIHAGRKGGVRSGVAGAPAFFINSVRHESSFGTATLLAAVQAAAGGS
jgi:protein-disulfide isomerase